MRLDSSLALGSRSIYDGWFIVAASFLGTATVFGVSYSFGVFFTHIVVEFGRSRGVVSLAFAVQTFVMCSGAALFAGVIDRFGVGRIWITGTLLFGAGLLGASRARSLPELFVTYGVVAAFGMSFIYFVSSTTLTRWFSGHRGLASGLASSGIGMGMLGIAPLSRHLVTTRGWRTAYLVVVVLIIGLLLIGALLLFQPDGATADRHPPPLRAQWRDIWPVVTSHSFLLVFIGWLLFYLPVYAVLAHFVPFVASVPGMTAATGAWALGAFGISTGLTRVIVGPIRL